LLIIDIINFPIVSNWEITVAFTHTVAGIEYGSTIFDARPSPIDEWQTQWKFTPVNGESLSEEF